MKPLPLPARSPNLNAHAERWVKAVKDERLSKVILFGEVLDIFAGLNALSLCHLGVTNWPDAEKARRNTCEVSGP